MISAADLESIPTPHHTSASSSPLLQPSVSLELELLPSDEPPDDDDRRVRFDRLCLLSRLCTGGVITIRYYSARNVYMTCGTIPIQAMRAFITNACRHTFFLLCFLPSLLLSSPDSLPLCFPERFLFASSCFPPLAVAFSSSRCVKASRLLDAPPSATLSFSMGASFLSSLPRGGVRPRRLSLSDSDSEEPDAEDSLALLLDFVTCLSRRWSTLSLDRCLSLECPMLQ